MSRNKPYIYTVTLTRLTVLKPQGCHLVIWSVLFTTNPDLLSILLSLIWSRRNKLCLQEAVVLLDRVALNASQYLLVYKKGNTYLVKRPQATKLIWKSPSTYNFKINFDGVVFEESREATQVSIRVVIRNSQG